MGRKSYTLTEENELNLKAEAQRAGMTINALLNRCIADTLARGITISVGGAATKPVVITTREPPPDPEWLTDDTPAKPISSQNGGRW